MRSLTMDDTTAATRRNTTTMPCDTRLREGVTLAMRKQQIDAALKKLEQALKARQVKVVIGPNGAIAFAGWTAADRDGVTDVCGYRVLAHSNSWELRQAVARAEQETGRKVNANAVAAGVHSHDGGHTFHKGH